MSEKCIDRSIQTLVSTSGESADQRFPSKQIRLRLSVNFTVSSPTILTINSIIQVILCLFDLTDDFNYLTIKLVNESLMESHEDSNNTENTSNNVPKNRSAVDAMRRYIESLPEEISLKEELLSFQFWKAVRTEFLATLMYVVLGCGSCLSYSSLPPKFGANSSTLDQSFDKKQSLEQMNYEMVLLEVKVSLVFGLTSATLIQCMGHVSGCHMTPAITISLLVTRQLTILRFILYVFVQCFASIVGSGILYGLLTTEQRSHSGLGLTLPNQQLNASQAFGYEFLATFVVVLTFLANSDPQRADAGFKSLSIGFAFSIAHLFSVSLILIDTK